jgi:glyoxylase I family protein
MNGRINHVMLNVNRYNEAQRFYGWLLPKVGYPNQTAFAEDAPKRGSGWYNDAGSVWCRRRRRVFAQSSSIGTAWDFAKSPSPPTVAARWTSFRRKSRYGGKVTDAPRQYDYVPRYYAVFFTDPDGLKLEVVHLP